MREADDMVGDLTGRDQMQENGDVLAANDTLHQTWLTMIREAGKQ